MAKPDVVGFGRGPYGTEARTSFAAPRIAGLAALVTGRIGERFTPPQELADYPRSNTTTDDGRNRPNND